MPGRSARPALVSWKARLLRPRLALPSAVSVRPYRDADLAVLSDLWLRASRHAHGFLGEERLRADQALLETFYFAQAETWVAEREGRQVGFVGLLEQFVGGLYVDPAAQGRGTGRALMARAQAARETLELEVYAANSRAMAFYRQAGFAEVSRRSEDDQGAAFETVCLRWQG